MKMVTELEKYMEIEAKKKKDEFTRMIIYIGMLFFFAIVFVVVMFVGTPTPEPATCIPTEAFKQLMWR